MMKTTLTKPSDNVFADLGFPRGRALSLKLRSELMAEVHAQIESADKNQSQAAHRFGVTQPRISDLVRGQIEKFSIDGLVEMLGHAGFEVALEVFPVENAGVETIDIDFPEASAFNQTWNAKPIEAPGEAQLTQVEDCVYSPAA